MIHQTNYIQAENGELEYWALSRPVGVLAPSTFISMSTDFWEAQSEPRNVKIILIHSP